MEDQIGEIILLILMIFMWRAILKQSHYSGSIEEDEDFPELKEPRELQSDKAPVPPE